MFKLFKKNNHLENELYNKILSLSRNKLFYTNFKLKDTFQNRINLIFMHISFLFIALERKNKKESYEKFSQNLFDLSFKKIETNMREIGYGDTIINKNMKNLVKLFYNILLKSQNYNNKNFQYKNNFFLDYLSINIDKKVDYNKGLIGYFDQYVAFCFDLRLDSVLRGDLNFNYK